MDHESHITPAAGVPGGQTRVHPIPMGPRIGAEALRGLVRTAARLSADRPWRHPGVPGYRLCFARPGDEGLGILDLPALPAAFAVVGRHRRAQVQLHRDGEIAHRHLLARSRCLPDGAVVLRLLDLRAELPFYLSDDAPHRSIVVSGPVGVRLGRYAIVALPEAGGARVTSAPPVLDAPVVHHSETPDRSTSAGLEDPAPTTTHITSLPRVSGVLDLLENGSPGDAMLTVERNGQQASVGIRAGDLRLGVMVGRLPRCVDGGVRSILSAEISRAHLLILQEEDAVVAFDLASTNGVRMDGARTRYAVLPDEGASLRLSGRGGVRLSYRRRPLSS